VDPVTTRRPPPISSSRFTPDFDKSYYDRYYRDPDTRAMTPAAARRQAAFIAAYLRHLGLPVTRLLDVGCGTGNLLRALGREFPRARAEGIEISPYLCSRYGWHRASVVDFSSRVPFDLIVCNDVLAYLDDSGCTAALGNLAGLCRGALFLGVLTEEDKAICDPERTDPAQIARPVAWYRRQLKKHFVSVGGGLFLKRPLPVTVWNLERA